MIVIPMAGMSSRFFSAGFDKPKYMLEAKGKTLFEHSLLSFKKYFNDEHFIFIVRNIYHTEAFVKSKAEALGIKNYNIVCLESETKGQAETVFLGVKGIESNNSLTIFNIDTFRPNFSYPKLTGIEDGYLEVFVGKGDNWSFVLPFKNSKTLIKETAEKRAISDLCCTGVYHFTKVSDFTDAYLEYKSKPKNEWDKGELYVAPLYNSLIKKGKQIHYHKIERTDVIFCGTPDEYAEFVDQE